MVTVFPRLNCTVSHPPQIHFQLSLREPLNIAGTEVLDGEAGNQYSGIDSKLISPASSMNVPKDVAMVPIINFHFGNNKERKR